MGETRNLTIDAAAKAWALQKATQPPQPELKGKCNMCGTCCKAIYLPYSHQELLDCKPVKDYVANPWDFEKRIGDHDHVFVHLYWEPITLKEALAINPHIATWKYGTEKEDNWYRCTRLDTKTNRCTVHDNQPSVCSGYPWYGRAPRPHESYYSPDCGYQVDVIQVKELAASDEGTRLEYAKLE
jgi:Fe-S-cluster containining protein